MKNCVDCVYFEGFRTDGEGTGECVRYPPIPILGERYGIIAQFPVVTLLTWCGEWEEKHEPNKTVS